MEPKEVAKETAKKIAEKSWKLWSDYYREERTSSDKIIAELEADINRLVDPFLTYVSGWVATTDKLPDPLQTVWLCNGKGSITLGCLVESDEGWHWAEGNGVIYVEKGEIVSECESEDLDVLYWHELPSYPILPLNK